MKCSICQWPIEPDPNGWSEGHNAEPVNSGRCCGICNDLIVTTVRLSQYLYRGASSNE